MQPSHITSPIVKKSTITYSSVAKKLNNREINLKSSITKLFAIRNPGNELYDVLRIFKRLTQLVISS